MVAIKKIYKTIKSFLAQHSKLGIFISASLFLVGCIAAIYSTSKPFVFIYFAASLAAIFRLTTYKTGKIPFIMIDKTWDSYRLKYPEEELEDRYKEMSIARATIYFIISVIAFILWIIFELLMIWN